MSFPVSRKRVDKLGQQLAATGFVDAEHRELFSQILEYYQELLDKVAEKISTLGYHPTTRVKTTGTLVEKIKREHGIQLSRIQDVAGARIIVGDLRAEQDQAVAEICNNFAELDRKPLIVDRRVDPRHGYRAVHVIVYPDGVPIEIQVRTTLQDLWAQIFENLADQWGRQIRYGGLPDSVSTLANHVGKSDRRESGMRRAVLQRLMRLSDLIGKYEEAIAELETFEQKIGKVTSTYVSEIISLFEEADESTSTIEVVPYVNKSYAYARSYFIGVCQLFVQDERRRSRIIRRNFPSCKQPEISDLRNAVNRAFPEARKIVVDARLNIARQEDGLRSILVHLKQLTEGGS